ncbi:tetratricopeptide repeat protein [Streptomyces beihaiensis]|uniref:Tetratricopeptide repeat protein n=1 Tax=Streptomyces beihaiensis TaxID=2984495 RepID=A0ABT3U5X0_9ACTN|nr:tetratricopeptide repeat protein [Streptomyces beihaiensis]MCX3063987.1 tetratricopeptide repeat protein [Streptomyces beihaiensis]
MHNPVETMETTAPEAPAPSEAAEAPRRLSPGTRRALCGVLAGCVVLCGVLVLLPGGADAPPSRPGPAGRAAIALAAGAPASLRDLAALIREREHRVRADPRDARSWAVLGAAYVEHGERTAEPAYYPKAERALRSSLRARPKGNSAALDALASLAAARGDWRAARKWGEAAVKTAPRDWTAYAGLVDAYRGLGDYKAAGKSLDKVSGMATGTAVTLRTTEVYQDRGWREDAAAVVSDASARATTPAERAALLRRGGELAWERGDPEGALHHFDAALGADPEDHASFAGRARALAALGRTQDAVLAYRAAVARRPDPEYALELGELYESLGQSGAARAQYDAARTYIERDRADGVDDALVQGRLEADHGDAQAAVAALRAEWKRARGARVADALGWALHKAGDDEEAIGLLRRATDTKHGGWASDALFAYHRGAVERRLELYGAARRDLGEALRTNPRFSPLLAPAARRALDALGDPPPGGPEEMWPPPEPKPRPRPAGPAAPHRKPAPAAPRRSARPSPPERR